MKYLLAITLLATPACFATVGPPPSPTSCEQRLSVRDREMKRYKKLCLFLSYAKSLYNDDSKAMLNINQGLAACKQVFGVK